MKILLTSLYLCLFGVLLNAQNYIPNPSFEDVNVCQTYVEKCCPKAWRSSTLKLHGYHFFASYRKDGIGAAQGSRYASILLFDTARDFDRKFLQVPLLCPLEAGRKYQLVLHYRAENNRVDTFGVFFADSLTISKKNKRFEGLKPQLSFGHSVAYETAEWHRLAMEYTATGREVGLIVGNFQADADTEIIQLNTEKQKKAKKNEYRESLNVWYYFDAFSLTPLESYDSPCNRKTNKDYIYKDSIRHKLAQIKIWPPSTTSTSVEKIALDSISLADMRLEEHLFESNSIELSVKTYQILDEFRKLLQADTSKHLRIICHTEQTGSTAYNQRISTQRAQAIADYLVLEGISPSRLHPTGKGELEPLSSTPSEDGKRRNQRTIFEVWEKE